MKVLSMTGVNIETFTTHSTRASSEANAFGVPTWEILKKTYYVWKIFRKRIPMKMWSLKLLFLRALKRSCSNSDFQVYDRWSDKPLLDRVEILWHEI